MAGHMILSTLVPRSYLRPAAAGFYKCRCLDSESAQYVAPSRMPSFPNCYPRKLRAHPKLRNAQAKAAQHDLRSAAPVGSRGVLLFDFSAAEVDKIRGWLQGVDPNLPIVSCGEFSNSVTLQESLSHLDAGHCVFQRSAAETSSVKPVAMFSGLSGQESIGLIEAWDTYTGITSCAFAAVTESMLPQTVSSLLASIRRESSGGKRIDSLYTLLGKGGKEKQTGDKEELRQQLQWAVKRSEERKRRRLVLRDEVDSTVEVLKEAKKPPKASGESRRGFG